MTQEKIIIERLKTHGHVYRNWALGNYITRLGAIICNLNKKGWDIRGDWFKYRDGKDYVYRVFSEPKEVKFINSKKPEQNQLFNPGRKIK